MNTADLKTALRLLLKSAITSLQSEDTAADWTPPSTFSIEQPKASSHGDFSSNIAMLLAKQVKLPPALIAQHIVKHLPVASWVEKVETAGPGFINFFIKDKVFWEFVEAVLSKGKQFGLSTIGQQRRVHIEFVSANPTGPLHVGHGRGAAYGDTVANLLVAVGFAVHREYYVNDAGRQMHILALSVWLRYLVLIGEEIDFPSVAYQGDYVQVIARQLKENATINLQCTSQAIYTSAILALQQKALNQDKQEDAYIDALIKQARRLLGPEPYQYLFDFALSAIKQDIQDDLEAFGVVYDKWLYESELIEKEALALGIKRLREAGHLYKKEGATWFRATQFGDTKDRVLIRDDGRHTYFAADVAYHLYKYQKQYDQIIDVFGADHHGYVSRIQGCLKALGCDTKKIHWVLVQFVSLYRDNKRLQMSTRSGDFITLRQLREEVGNDVARFFYIMQKIDQTIDFDIDLAKSRSHDNPVYYIQYAHARVCRVFEQLAERGLIWDAKQGLHSLAELTETQEQDLLRNISQYPDTLKQAALKHAPHYLAYYLQQLANNLHTYYNAHQFIVEKETLRNARLCLIAAVKQIIANGLAILGMHAPTSM